MRESLLILAAVASIGVTCASAGPGKEVRLTASPPFTDSNRDGFWKTADPQDCGIKKDILLRHIGLCERTGADSQIITCGGRIVSEWYSDRYALPVYAMSSTKAVTSLLVGILMDSGKIESTDAKLGIFLPGWTTGLRGSVTIGHILTHSSGLPRLWERGKSVGFETDKTGFVMGLEPSTESGKVYAYSNEAVQLLDAVLEKASGTTTVRFAHDALFHPLGMDDTSLNTDSMGHAWTYADMKTTARDMGRIGQLMLNGGMWNGKRIISADYLDRAVSPSNTNREMGYLWWILYDGDRRIGYYASGYLNTDIYVLPEKEMVIVRTQAPKAGFSGRNESGDYFRHARKIFGMLLKP